MLMGGKSVSSVTIASGEREIRDQQRGPAICLRARAGLVSVPETARIRLAAFDQATARRHPHTMLWVRACQTAMLRTLSRPRTTNCRSATMRAWALEHSAVAAALCRSPWPARCPCARASLQSRARQLAAVRADRVSCPAASAPARRPSRRLPPAP